MIIHNFYLKNATVLKLTVFSSENINVLTLQCFLFDVVDHVGMLEHVVCSSRSL